METRHDLDDTGANALRERSARVRAGTGRQARGDYLGSHGSAQAFAQSPASDERFAGARKLGGIPEWPKGSDCKSDGNAFTGSNPVPPTPRTQSISARSAGLAPCLCPLALQRRPRSHAGRALHRSASAIGGRSSMVERQPSKLNAWVRFPSPAPRAGALRRAAAFARPNVDLVADPRTRLSRRFLAAVAQPVEHFLGKEEVTGSIPVSSSSSLLSTPIQFNEPRG